jgi:hypothetical protein
MAVSENDQLLAMACEIKEKKLDRALRSHDWAPFARGTTAPRTRRIGTIRGSLRPTKGMRSAHDGTITTFAVTNDARVSIRPLYNFRA